MKKSNAATAVAPRAGNLHDSKYISFLAGMQEAFVRNVGVGPVFATTANNGDALWPAYLAAFPATQRQYHTCHACREFVRVYGGLVSIGDDGSTVPVVWHGVPASKAEAKAIEALRRVVSAAKVTGVFLSPLRSWGHGITGEWLHFSVTPPPALVYRPRALTAGQAAAEKAQDFEQVVRALTEYPLPLLASALRVVQSDTLYRAEKAIGPLKWLHDLSVSWSSAKGRARTNLVWRAVAAAPAGFCHPRSSMAGTLLDDLAAGTDFDAVAARWKEKMHPLQYQRPTAPPTDGAIDAAEKLVEKLGIAASLKRRFCRVDEVEAIWRPQEREKAAGEGVFSKLRAKPAGLLIDLPAGAPMTFARFSREILPEALEIEIRVPSHGPFIVFTTASESAPPIFQWDFDSQRNPVSWYYWHGGSPASSHGLSSGFVPCAAVTLVPAQWYGAKLPHVAPGAVFLLAGATETRCLGAAIFPENLKSELHAIKSIVEAYSLRSEIEGIGNQCAVGLAVRGGAGSPNGVAVRVKTAGGRQTYIIDRWE